MSARGRPRRDQASSPPKQVNPRSSQSPLRRSTRSTRSRSASVELGKNTNEVTSRRVPKRGSRQSSVESNASNESHRPGRRATRATAVAARDLSIVAEDLEDDEVEYVEDADADDEYNAGRSQSVAESQLSGTTARTTYIDQELDNMNYEYMIRDLPGLLHHSYGLITVMAPTGASAAMIESIREDLQDNTSERAGLFKRATIFFDNFRDKYGNNVFIEIPIVLRKLLGSNDPGEGNFRPDAVLHAANLATLLKYLPRTRSDGTNLDPVVFFQATDTNFPMSFVSEFDDRVQFGSSRLLQESFSLALGIRTQYAIVQMMQNEVNPDFDPDSTLRQIFLVSEADDDDMNPDVKSIEGMQAVLGPEERTAQTLEIQKLFQKIRSTFKPADQATKPGFYVDFDKLEELFPWNQFYFDVVQYSRLRLAEINRSINAQGGVKSLVKSLKEAPEDPIKLSWNPDRPHIQPDDLLPPAENPAVEDPREHGPDLLNLPNVAKMMKWKKRVKDGEIPILPSTEAGPSNATASSQRNTTSNKSKKPAVRASALSNLHEMDQQVVDDYEPIIGEDDRSGQAFRPNSEYLSSWVASSNDKNKENRPLIQNVRTKRRMTGKQPDLGRTQIGAQESIAESSKLKRSRQTYADTDEGGTSSNSKRSRYTRAETEVSEDEGFEEDRRLPNPGRRTTVPRARNPISVPQSRPQAQAYNNYEDLDEEGGGDNGIEDRPDDTRSKQRRLLHVRVADRNEDEDSDLEDIEINRPSATFSEVQASAKTAITKAKYRSGNNDTQRRTAWSEHDSELLLTRINQIGCSWTGIAQMGGFEHERGQVALKDKARNMKVAFLKSGIPLPANFQHIALGRKELASVRAVVPDYEDERERARD